MIEFLATASTPRPNWRHLGEMAILGALFAGWSWFRPFPLTEPFGFAAILFGLLLLCQLFPQPGRFQAAAFLWIFAIPAALYARHVAEFQARVGLEEGPNGLRPLRQIWVPYLALGWRDFLALALPFLLGASAAQPRFRLGRFVCGYLLGAAALGAALYGPLILQNVALGDGHFDLYNNIKATDVLMTEEPNASHFYGAARGLWGGMMFGLLLSLAAIGLPEIRRSLQASLGISLSPREPRAARSEGFALAAAAHLNLILLLFAAGGFAVYGHYERKMIISLRGGSELWPEAPKGAVNALDELRPAFSKDEAPWLKIKAAPNAQFEARRSKRRHEISLPMPYDYQMLANWKSSAEAVDAAVAPIDREAFAMLFAELGPYIRAVDRLREADGSWRWNGKELYRLNLHNAWVFGRVVATRGLVELADGRDDDALRDIERVYNFGWAVQDRADLLGSLNGLTIRNCATNVAYNFYLHRRGDAEALRKLETLLWRLRPRARLLIDPKMLERSGPTFWPVVPAFERNLAVVTRRREQLLGATAEYDRLLIALALERFNRDRGSYPKALGELAPAYFDAEPLDPIDGMAFIYEPRGDGFVLDYKDLVATRKSGPSPPAQAPIYQEDCANQSLETEIKAAPKAAPTAEGAPQP